jgi:hypothetical protein
MSGLKTLLLNLIESALLGFDQMLESSENVLTKGYENWDFIVSLSNKLKPFCYVVISICLLIELAQVAAKVDIIKWEIGLKIMVKMVLARVFIDLAPDFLKACYLKSVDWIKLLTSSPDLKEVPTIGNLVNEEVESLLTHIDGIWNILGLFFSVFIVVLAIKLCGLVIQVIAFGRLFELYIYLAISPLPCAFFPLGGGDGGGFSRITAKFLRSFAAICLQGVVMLICIRVFDIILSKEIEEGIIAANSMTGAVAVSDLCFTMLLGSIVLVMSIVKCGSWAKSILDAA